MPAGFIDGLPVGVQLLAPYFQEARLLNVAHQYQQVSDWHLRARPDSEEIEQMQWETVIGLEIHAQLSTQSKIFSGSATFGAEPNTQASLVDLGMPGTLPVLNAEAVRMACKFGLAIDAEIAEKNVFARKNYFYPDLPKGYQTSQMDHPIVGKGHLDITLEDGSTSHRHHPCAPGRGCRQEPA